MGWQDTVQLRVRSKQMTYFPVYLNLKGRRVVVVGGGSVAERKVASLLDSGAAVSVISPEVTERLTALADREVIELHKRPYAPGDCRGALLVLTTTDDDEVNTAVFNEARDLHVLVNTADAPALCDFIMPAIVRRGDLRIAISTGGASPALSATLRRKLSRILGPEYGRLLSLMTAARADIRERVHSGSKRKNLHYKILSSDVLRLLRNRDTETAKRRVQEIIDDFEVQERNP